MKNDTQRKEVITSSEDIVNEKLDYLKESLEDPKYSGLNDYILRTIERTESLLSSIEK